MPGWVLAVYVTLGVVAFGFLIAWWVTRKRRDAVGLGVTALLTAGFALLLWLIPTDQKRIERALKEMSAGVKERNADKVFAHVSEDFRLAGMDKADFRRFVEPRLRNGDVTEVEVWDVKQAEVSRADRTATVEFSVKPKGPAVRGQGQELDRK